MATGLQFCQRSKCAIILEKFISLIKNEKKYGYILFSKTKNDFFLQMMLVWSGFQRTVFETPILIKRSRPYKK